MTSGDRPGSGSDLSDMRSLPKWAGGRVSPPLERDRWRCGTLGGTEGSKGLRAAGVTRIGLRPCETTVARGRKVGERSKVRMGPWTNQRRRPKPDKAWKGH